MCHVFISHLISCVDVLRGRGVCVWVCSKTVSRIYSYILPCSVTKTFDQITIQLICHAFICDFRTLRMAREMRADMTESKMNQAEAKITVMLLFVSTVMIICLLPEVAISTIYSLVPEFNVFKKYHNIFMASQYLVFLARSVNSASNFFMYLALSTKFRVTFLQLFPCCWRRAAEPKHLTEATVTLSVSTNQTGTL